MHPEPQINTNPIFPTMSSPIKGPHWMFGLKVIHLALYAKRPYH